MRQGNEITVSFSTAWYRDGVRDRTLAERDNTDQVQEAKILKLLKLTSLPGLRQADVDQSGGQYEPAKKFHGLSQSVVSTIAADHPRGDTLRNQLLLHATVRADRRKIGPDRQQARREERDRRRQ